MFETTTTKIPLAGYKTEMEDELQYILTWWREHMEDSSHGGFHGSVNNRNVADSSAPKGIVLNSRILWAFSAAYRVTRNPEDQQMARKAFNYIIDHFIDPVHGGVYWSVTAEGAPLDRKKQVYGHAFCLYAMCEYYKISRDEMALHCAKDMMHYIERYSYDHEKKGYIEAFSEEWSDLGDLRLSEKDHNEKKTMNTHLHVIEAYASLYNIWPKAVVQEKIVDLLEVFDQYFISKKNYHLQLFFNQNWEIRSTLISFGHDIEAAWLLLECAETAGTQSHMSRFRELAVRLADAASEGLDKDGGLWYEFEPENDSWILEKHAWPQAEAMVGFLQAFQLTGTGKYLQHSVNAWRFIATHLKDPLHGEWRWGITADGMPMNKEKAGFWKCPYHSVRACIEVLKRLDKLKGP